MSERCGIENRTATDEEEACWQATAGDGLPGLPDLDEMLGNLTNHLGQMINISDTDYNSSTNTVLAYVAQEGYHALYG
jgi:hypothetical protein